MPEIDKNEDDIMEVDEAAPSTSKASNSNEKKSSKTKLEHMPW